MASTKRHLPILLLSLIVFWSANLAAEDGSTSYSGYIGMYNPCNNDVVTVSGTNYVRIHPHAHEHDDARVSIHFRFVGSGQDLATGSTYRTVLMAEGEFQTAMPSYDIQYRSMWIGQNGAPSFSMDGTLRVWVQSGVAHSDGIMTYETACRKDAWADDKDSHDDHDRDSRGDRD